MQSNLTMLGSKLNYVKKGAHARGLRAVKVIQNGVKPFLNETVKKSCFHVDFLVDHFQAEARYHHQRNNRFSPKR